MPALESNRPTLFRHYPSLVDRVPWHPLGNFPTLLVPAAGFLSRGSELWLKRDDRSAALYGGNKVRKLEFLLADALRRRVPKLVTTGAWGSHHVLATALYGRALGFAVEAIVFPQPLTTAVRETLLLDAAAGASLVPAASYAELPLRIAAARMKRGIGWIPPGGSSPLGTLGYVSAGLELAQQWRGTTVPAPDVIYLALGSCGTAAGLGLGLALAGWKGSIVGVRVVDNIVASYRAVRRLAQGALRLLRRAGLEAEGWEDEPRLTVEHQFFGGAYGRALPEAERTMARAAEIGLSLESTYTGKAFAALLAHAEDGRLDGKRVLFLDTYSSVDLSALRARSLEPDVRAGLPASLHRLFSE